MSRKLAGGARARVVGLCGESALGPLQAHRFPDEIISHAVWLYSRFLLSYQDVEEPAGRARIAVSYETIRRWCQKFGQGFADGLRRRRPRPGDTWHLDEVQLKINGQRHWRWRAVDQDGLVLDILVQRAGTRRRPSPSCAPGGRAGLPATGGDHGPTGQLPARRAHVLPGVEHRWHTGLNNRAEHSTAPRDDESERCNGSRHRSRRSSSSPRSARSATTSVPAGTASLPRSTTTCCRPASPPGATSRASPRVAVSRLVQTRLRSPTLNSAPLT